MRTTIQALNRLCKWRSVFAGWQLGTQWINGDAARMKGLAAIRDAADARLVMRVEMNALLGLLIKKGIITKGEWDRALCLEAEVYATDLEGMFPGFKATDMGLDIDIAKANETMERLRFPP